MGFVKQKSITNIPNSNTSPRRMRFLFLFFPDNDTSASIAAVKNRRCRHRSIIATVQSTVSICALLIFFTLFLFTLFFDPKINTSHSQFSSPRRQLSTKSHDSPGKSSTLSENPMVSPELKFGPALQGMGYVYCRGSRAMNDVVVAHAVESLTPIDLRLFLQLFFRSGLPAKSDLVLIFRSRSPDLDRVVADELDSFLKLVRRDPTRFRISGKKARESGETIWGRRRRQDSEGGNATESSRLSYGSVVGFDSDELDPEDSLSGFLDHEPITQKSWNRPSQETPHPGSTDCEGVNHGLSGSPGHVPMSLRRWACYPMLLERIRRNFRHVTLVDPKEILLLGDPLGRVKNRSPDSVFLSTLTHPDRKRVDPGIVSGGARAVRKLSNAMLVEIVRTAMQREKTKKNPITESRLINQLVENEFIRKKVNITVMAESIASLSSLTGLNSKPGASLLARPVNSSNSLVILKSLCSLYLDSTVYSDC